MITTRNIYCDSDSLCHDGICGRLDGHDGDHVDPLDGRRWHNDADDYGQSR